MKPGLWKNGFCNPYRAKGQDTISGHRRHLQPDTTIGVRSMVLVPGSAVVKPLLR